MSAAPAEEKFSYLEILGQGWAYLRANSRLLLISTVVATVAGLVAAHVTRLEYRASLIVAPQEGVSTAGSMSGLQDLAGLASGSRGLRRLSQAIPWRTSLHSNLACCRQYFPNSGMRPRAAGTPRPRPYRP